MNRQGQAGAGRDKQGQARTGKDSLGQTGSDSARQKLTMLGEDSKVNTKMG